MPTLPVSRILIPTDLSLCSLAAFAPARLIAESTGAEILILSVVDRSRLHELHPLLQDQIESETRHARTEAIARLAGKMPARLKVRWIVPTGDIELEIVRQAAREKADLIVMGTHAWTGHRHGFVERVVRSAPCPVLVIQAHVGAPADAPVEGESIRDVSSER